MNDPRIRIAAGAACCVLLLVLVFASVSGSDEEAMDNAILRKKLKEQVDKMDDLRKTIDDKERLLKVKEKMIASGNKGGLDLDEVNRQLESKEEELSQLQRELQKMQDEDQNNLNVIEDQAKELEQKEEVIADANKKLLEKDDHDDEKDQQNKDKAAEVVEEVEKDVEKQKSPEDGRPLRQRIPNEVRFIHLRNETFDVFAYVAVEAVLAKIEPTTVFIHYEEEPSGRWFELVKKKVQLEELDLSASLSNAMKADPFADAENPVLASAGRRSRKNLMKIDLLYRFGGIVVDYNNVVLNDFDDALNTTASIVVGDKANGDIGLDVVLSRKGHPLWGDLLNRTAQAGSGGLRASARSLTAVIKLYAAQQEKGKEDIRVIPSGAFYALDRVRFSKVLSGKIDDDKLFDIMNKARILHLYQVNQRLAITEYQIRKKANPITSILNSFMSDKARSLLATEEPDTPAPAGAAAGIGGANGGAPDSLPRFTRRPRPTLAPADH